MAIILAFNSHSLRLCLGNCRMSLVEGELCLGGETDTGISLCSSSVCSSTALLHVILGYIWVL